MSFRNATFKAMNSLLLEDPCIDITSIVFSDIIIIK